MCPENTFVVIIYTDIEIRKELSGPTSSLRFIFLVWFGENRQAEVTHSFYCLLAMWSWANILNTSVKLMV